MFSYFCVWSTKYLREFSFHSHQLFNKRTYSWTKICWQLPINHSPNTKLPSMAHLWKWHASWVSHRLQLKMRIPTIVAQCSLPAARERFSTVLHWHRWLYCRTVTIGQLVGLYHVKIALATLLGNWGVACNDSRIVGVLIDVECLRHYKKEHHMKIWIVVMVFTSIQWKV